jgi:hypothetical protein
MSNQSVINSYELIVGNKVKTIKDKKSKSRVANFPFDFADGTKGVVVVIRLKDEDWNPSYDIKSINIIYND